MGEARDFVAMQPAPADKLLKPPRGGGKSKETEKFWAMKHVGPVVVAFDLGDTLLEYEGIPFSWEAHYSEALQALAASLLRRKLTTAEIADGCTVPSATTPGWIRERKKCCADGCQAVLLDRKGARPDWGQSITLRTLDEWIF